MTRNLKVKSEWFIKEDEEHRKLSSYLERKNDYEVLCKVCSKVITVKSNGFNSIKQHISNKSHLENMKLKFNSCPNQKTLHFGGNFSKLSNLLFFNEIVLDLIFLEKNSLAAFTIKDNTTKAEILMLLKVIANNGSLRSCDNLGDVLKIAFADSIAVQNFSLNHNKAGYLLNEALGPYFRDKLIKDVDRKKYFCILFDETTNSAGKKELQVCIRYWSTTHECIVTRHLETFFISYATAKILVEKIMEAIKNSGLSASMFFMLGMDGPNTNKAVFRLLNEEIKMIRGRDNINGLLDLGSCNLHIVHNTFLKGLKQYGLDVSDVITQIFNWFDGWPVRKDDFESMCKKKNIDFKSFIKHVSSRWLTILPAAERLLYLLPAVKHYFLWFLPNEKKIVQSLHYKNICKYLNQKDSEDIEIQLMMVVESSTSFTKFLTIFQKTEPMIHLLYDHMKNLIRIVASKICIKSDLPLEKLFMKDNLSSTNQIVLSDSLNAKLENFNTKNKMIFNTKYRDHYLSAGNYLILKSTANLENLKCFRSLNPKHIQDKKNIDYIRSMLKTFPASDVIFNVKVLDEFKLFQFEEPVLKIETNLEVDKYWNEVFKKTDKGKYLNLELLVKSLLCVSHGNSDVERGFSSSGLVLTDERSLMSVKTLNARLNTLDAIRHFNKKVHLIPIDMGLIKLAQNARRKYEEYLDEEKKKKEKKETEDSNTREKKKLEKANKEKSKQSKLLLQNQIAKGEEELREKQQVTDSILDTVQQKLKDCLQKKDMAGAIIVAQQMLDLALSNRSEEKLQQQQLLKTKEKINLN